MDTRCRLTPAPINISPSDLELSPLYNFNSKYFALMARYTRGENGTDTEAGAYVYGLVNNRTAYPFCGAGEPTGKVSSRPGLGILPHPHLRLSRVAVGMGWVVV
jgi:hypothetical protein